MSMAMWKRTAAVALLALLLLPGIPRVQGEPPYIKVETGPYVAGESVTIRLGVVNPGATWANYTWNNSCVIVGSIVSERRVIAFWTYGGSTICFHVMMYLEIPPNSSVLWRVFTFETRSDDGCIRIDVSLRGYPVSGTAETCPSPVQPPPSVMALTVSTRLSVLSGEVFEVVAIVRTMEGQPVEGIWIEADLGTGRVGAGLTGPDGRISLPAQAPEVQGVTAVSLLVQGSAPGWRNASRAVTLTIFPPAMRHLVLRATYATGDIVRGGGIAILDVSIRSSDDQAVANVSLAVEAEAPLRVTERVDLGGGRFAVTLEADAVDEGCVASVRLVANAPGLDGAEARLDYVVLPETTSGPGGTEEPAEPSPLAVPLAASLIVAAALTAASLFVWRRRRSRRDPQSRGT